MIRIDKEKEEINPYPKFSKQCDKPAFRICWEGLSKSTKKQLKEALQEEHTDSDWLLWQIKHGKHISSDNCK